MPEERTEAGARSQADASEVSSTQTDGVKRAAGKPYRTGFLKAMVGGVSDPSNPALSRQLRRENNLSVDGELYHYTSVGGFQGIIQSGGFWASDNRFMNDAEEMRDGAQLASRILAHRARKVGKSSIGAVLTAVQERIAAPPTQGLLVVCFSNVRDSLEQWRGYGGTGGISLKLGPVKSGQRHVFIGPQQLPVQAFYKFRPKAALILSIVRRFEREYELDQKAMPNDWPDDHDKDYADYLHSLISGRIVAFKNESFALESEVRLAIPYSYADKYDGSLKFRATALGLVPYLCTGDLIADRKAGRRLLPLEEVMIGPHPRQELIGESVQTFLKHHGYSVPVALSKVPYRA